jgi:hypothetical protein
MYIALRPTELQVVAGSSVEIDVTVIDPDGGSLSGLMATFAGIEPSWVRRVDAERSDAPLSVAADRASALFSITVPTDHPVGERVIAIGIRADEAVRGVAFERLPLHVVARAPVRVTTDPSIADGRRRVEVSLVVSSESASDLVVVPVGEDPEGLIDFTFDRSRIEVPSGADRSVGVRLRGGRPISGRSHRRVVRVGVDAGERVMVDLSVVQRPVLPTPVLAVVAAVLAVVLIIVFGATSWFDRTSTSSPASTNGNLEVIDLVRTGAKVAGRVVTPTGDPIPGVEVDLFDVDDPISSVMSSATDSSGEYRFVGVASGSFTVRAVAAGFATSWNGDVDQFSDADVLAVQTADVIVPDLMMDGLPGRVLGRLSSVDRADVVVTATPVDREGPTVMSPVRVGTGGVFDLIDLATPGRFELAVSRGDVALTSVVIDLGPGEERGDVTIVVPAGEGSVSGVVSTAAGPLGDVSVTVTDGMVDVSTSTLTQGDVGRFTIDDLAVPGRYTVNVSRDGFGSESIAVDLTNDDPSASVAIELTPALASIVGRVTDAAGSGIGGVTVRATADGVDVSTVSVDGTAGRPSDVGRFVLDGLASPSSLTLSFSADGFVTRTEEVTLSSTTSGPREVTAVLVSASSTVTGIVRDPDGQPIAGATIVLSDGVRSSTTRSAHEPSGTYRFVGVTPGTHTLTVRVPGAAPVVMLIDIGAGETVGADVAVGATATVRGRVVTSAAGTPVVPVAGATVRLFRLAQFPGSNADAVATVITGADGTFELSGFDTPGDYVVAVSAPSAPAIVATSVTVRPTAGEASPIGDIDLAG